MYRAGELKQWEEHVRVNAVRALGLEESLEVIKKVKPERTLNSRFPYRDKKIAKQTRLSSTRKATEPDYPRLEADQQSCYGCSPIIRLRNHTTQNTGGQSLLYSLPRCNLGQYWPWPCRPTGWRVAERTPNGVSTWVTDSPAWWELHGAQRWKFHSGRLEEQSLPEGVPFFFCRRDNGLLRGARSRTLRFLGLELAFQIIKVELIIRFTSTPIAGASTVTFIAKGYPVPQLEKDWRLILQVWNRPW